MGMQKELGDICAGMCEAHTSSEPHHEAYFKRTNGTPSDDNLLEMAVDRLARNLQKNNSEYNWNQNENISTEMARASASMRKRSHGAIHRFLYSER